MNALFFVAFGVSSMFGVWLYGVIVPLVGFGVLFNVLGSMTCISLVINWKLKYSFETKMPFVKQPERSATATAT